MALETSKKTIEVETLIGADVPGTLVELMATPAET